MTCGPETAPRRSEPAVQRTATGRIPTGRGEFSCQAWRSTVDGIEHTVLVRGDIAVDEPLLVRVHSECFTGDLLGSERCDCGTQLSDALDLIAQAGRGALIYLRGHEGRGIGLTDKLRAYELQDAGYDTVDANVQLGLPADARDYGIAARILEQLGVCEVRLMTNNPAKCAALEGHGLRIVERVALAPRWTSENADYLRTKRERMGHLIPSDPRPASTDLTVAAGTNDHSPLGRDTRAVQWRTRGEVVHGDQRGRELGFPTANLRLATVEPPPFGVYAARLDGRPAAVSVGVRPTFGEGLEPFIEAHVLDFSGDLYGRDVTVELFEFIRPEARFDDVGALVRRMHQDIDEVRRLDTLAAPRAAVTP